MKNLLTYLQAYNATYRFIDIYYWKVLSDGIRAMLSDMEFLHDKITGDPTTWNAWLDSLKK